MAPVVSSALGVLGPLLVKLTALLADECGRLKGIRHEIRSLRSELTSMHSAVQKYTMIEDPDVQAKTWISLVRELAYDTEDCIDKFIHHLKHGGQQGGIKEFFRSTVHHLKVLRLQRRIANQIDELKTRVKEVKELKSSYRLDDLSSFLKANDIYCSTSAVDPRLSALFAEEAHLVGIDGPRDDLVKWMVEEENTLTKHQRRVLSIVGFGGLGKTTLANEVYRKIQGHFHYQVFVSVSQKPDIKKIIKDVISQLDCQDGFTKDTNNWDEKRLIAKLRELIKDERYLVIIDDIWSIPAWEAIKCAFPENNCSSRIIATTRIVGVARSCSPGGDDRIYEMNPLGDLHSKRLFFRRIFHSEECPCMLKEVSNEILKKCGGLPLAIISISGLLANRPPVKEEWEKVKRSIGSALEKNRSLEGMNSILSLSYNDLPPNLKTCLLYVSNFPGEYVIERERLVRRWIAEGFISDERGQSRQEVAENYFYELINKNMVQPVGIGYDGKARACRVHDMMLELIISKSADENFITVLSVGETVWENSHGYIRRLSIQHIDQELASILVSKDLHHVRSLGITTTGSIELLPSLVKFESLRVLDFEGCEVLEEYDLNGMEKLFQVKYMSFRDTGISRLPSGIAMLHDLETLDLRSTYIQELPAGIVQLTKLKHLLTGRRFGGGRTKIPDGIGNMGNLRVISGLNITMSSIGAVEELGNLTNLVHLGVELNGGGSDKYKRHEEMLLSSLCKLGTCELQSLLIFSNDSTPLEFLDSWSPIPSSLQRFEISTNYYLLNTPKWIVQAVNSLAHLRINVIEVTQEDLRMLGKLHALLSLELWLKSDPKERLTIQGFPSLKEFVFVCREYQGGAYTTFRQGAMPKLEKLRLPFHVPMATAHGFYFGIGHLPYLKQAWVHLYNMGAGYYETKAAVAAIRSEADVHLNHPRVAILGQEEEDSDTDGN